MKTLLWVDDIRDPIYKEWLSYSPIGKYCNVFWAKNFQESINFLEETWPDAICLDHDLGEEKSGYDIAKYIVNKCIDNNLPLPLFTSQSMNPIGKENILKLLANYQKFNTYDKTI